MPLSRPSSRPTNTDEHGGIAVLSVLVLASTLAACALLVAVCERMETAFRLQWNADVVALASAHSDRATVDRLARAIGVTVVQDPDCGVDACVTVSDPDGVAVSGASRG